MSEKLKREFIELLEKDVEFRYIVAGYLGLSEILKRLDRLEEGQNKLWEEVKSLREGQEKLWENQNKLWEEVKSLREGQNKLWENQNKLWLEVKSLREGQDRMYIYMRKGFTELRRTLGATFEDHAASFLEVMLDEMGYREAKVEKKYLVDDGEVFEINLFCEEPLVVGEATTRISTTEQAEEEVKRLLKRIEIVERRYGKKPFLAILSVAVTMPEVHEKLKNITQEHGIKLITGRGIEEQLT